MSNANRDVWVFVEQREGSAAEVSFELLSKGRKLADQLGGALKALAIGHELDEVVRQAFRYGSDEVLLIEHEALRDYRTLPYSRVVGDLIAEQQPRIVLFGATFIGRDLAPRVASFTRSGLTADCTDLKIGDASYLRRDYTDLLLQVRPAFGGNIIATIITPEAPVQMATVREGVMELVPQPTPRGDRVTRIPYEPRATDNVVTVLERHREERRNKVKSAPIVVAGGYGMGNQKNFALLHQLAALIGGEVAGTRAAVDAGFIKADRQVGQTGLTVRPKLYIACGISGAIQHRAGMQESTRIIAINTDADAPIFDACHYGIVGDAAAVLPLMIDAYRERLK
ncbi:MAG: electron transfer flavoprotein subunit alpha/FixB family protein [Proteobacteria bacterium]|nr:electron transfer flavoprotein subunit alpha/FixB family protein [Pseudomonadota bacterium]